MTIACDYAAVFELDVRPRRNALRRAAALAVWTGLFLVRPKLALAIWREARGA
ncbi:hypothetical protein [Phenylobacterium soli]|uniref:hypothetical protein n=1 Tax=Phenylobacterium soli TaxID=2170551 RepID=UPI001403F0FA|nr:hypothetical protein [Phenylobacterium soli]